MNKIIVVLIALFACQVFAKQGSEGVGGGNISTKRLLEEVLRIEKKIVEKFVLNYSFLPNEVQKKLDLIKRYAGS